MDPFSNQDRQSSASERFSRRNVLQAGITVGAGLLLAGGKSEAQDTPEKKPRPGSNMVLDRKDTALVVIDPQNDVLSDRGVSWGLLHESLKENNTVENLARLFTTAKENDFGVFISPHYLYPHDLGWQFGGAVEKLMLEGKEFWRPDPLSLKGFSGSGADWLDRFKPFIEDGETIVASPQKVYGCRARPSGTRAIKPGLFPQRHERLRR